MDTLIKKRIKQVKKGDQSAFAEIVELFKDKVYQLCYRMVGNAHDAEDIAQEAFIRAYVNINSYDTNRKFSTWLYRIATNLSIDRLRKRKPDYFLDAEIEGTEGFTMYSQIPSDELQPDEMVETLEFQEWIQQEINELPVMYRSVIVLKYIEELSLKEIGDILDLPIGTVKTRIHRGREALRKRLRNV
ncbi:RNA polymerase, sigma subunit, SigW [Schinkia azotoformans MEV2011]|uniref:RNA polymerase sigma factor n=1 Tax=Schinkia azotoformans MEV2011 TaxID=1348973 RepID=A0A072NLW9_SCHAZ|nr:RNA polymerase sigma factor SigW [Schinkia azotoformans]KEF38639.1 RNA polymerase, sigma subunit, SigW [Schinkia azotoformans MEV2011]MEC1693952.1 RNA polymerase sigma factor SigW [Schinkia azotoformans]MEC1714785.1 RNA polymerase sigma factor SigW [Schinkia azotoformans]MEC1727086.1 RNA polymerase sigma factor SigW [Schinkia azotoformans]MEC1742247.1 RNA polymerase sigma factor SigW [Schinkia azotoformans]